MNTRTRQKALAYARRICHEAYEEVLVAGDHSREAHDRLLNAVICVRQIEEAFV